MEKDLQIKKNLFSEPLHLEAALEYVDIRSELAPTSSKSEHTLFFYKRLRDDFTSESNALLAEYEKGKDSFPEKYQTYKTYMQYVDSCISYLEAQLAKEEGYSGTAIALKKQAISQLDTLRDSEQPKTLFLEKRIERALKEIDASL